MRHGFRSDFKNGIAGWCFSEEELDEAYRNSGILMLDMEFGTTCRLNCSYCFRTNDYRDRLRPTAKPLSARDVKVVVDQAKEMGVKSIHFVGKGESLEEEDFLEISHYIAKRGMIPLIFTAGHVLGDDKLAMDIHGKTGVEIVKELYKSKASVILKINSLNDTIQNDVVRTSTMNYKDGSKLDFNYTWMRDIALDRLIEAGFNSLKHNPTRLGTASVILKSNYCELFHHYRYFRSLNIYPIINTVVPCGRTKDMTKVSEISPSEKEKIELWKKIYSFNIENGIKYEGISSYVGGHVCSQLGYAMYINVFGEVFDCPSSTRKSPIGNVRFNGANGQRLSELWKKSPNRRTYYGCHDNGCPWRFQHSAMIPRRLFKEVHQYLKAKYPHDKDVMNFVPDTHVSKYYS
jgi:MoaA/NifB/PqqE/SkfB family radical SAM enzyme